MRPGHRLPAHEGEFRPKLFFSLLLAGEALFKTVTLRMRL